MHRTDKKRKQKLFAITKNKRLFFEWGSSRKKENCLHKGLQIKWGKKQEGCIAELRKKERES